MSKILVVYYTHTGNTEKMAQAVAEGAKAVQGVEVELKRQASPWKLADFDAILIGAPTYQHNMTANIRKLLEEIAFHEVNLEGKVGAAFGSYGWSGEAPRFVLEVMENKFRMDVLKPPLLIKYAPDEKGLVECRKLGRDAAEKALKST
ncbi:MAG: FprA family A-type flavoprotein [Candidatus Bathyarchaeota archaeon]|nr:MAG: FprA family A-type flavoprotein [Candidatus Bathyarchaeota archaeon]